MRAYSMDLRTRVLEAAEAGETTAEAVDPNRVVFVDETGADTQQERRYGYAPRGQPCRGAVPRGHYKRRTFTAGLRAGGSPGRCSTGR